MDDRSRQEVALHAAVDRIGGQMVDEFEAILERSWKPQLDLTKILLSLSSASLALVATFGQRLVGNTPPPAARVLCGGSLCFLVLTIVAAVLTLWQSIKVAEFRLLTYNAAERIAKKALPYLEQGQRPGEVVPEELDSVRKKVVSGLKTTDRLFNATLVLFVASYVLLGVFGWIAYDI